MVAAGAEVLHVAFDNDTRDFESAGCESVTEMPSNLRISRDRGTDNLGIVAVLDLGLDADTNLRGVC